MTLVYQRHINGPKTHVMAIGCGRFQNFPPQKKVNRVAPVVGARKVMAFFSQKADKLVAPLASIECLISDPAVVAGGDKLGVDWDADSDDPAPPAPPQTRLDTGDSVDPATFNNVKLACDAWLKRCSPGDFMVFYMSTHGVAGIDGTLGLCEDVNSNDLRRWEESLNVFTLAQGLPTRNAGRSFVFFDACQEIIPELLGQIDARAGWNPIIYTLQQLAQTRERTCAIAGSRLGGKAWAPKDSVGEAPYFTQALLDGMRRSSVEALPNLGWTVTGGELADNLPLIAEAALGWRGLETELLTNWRQRDFALLTVEKPSVPVCIRTHDNKDLTAVLLAQVLGDDGHDPAVPPPSGSDWRFRFEPHLKRQFTANLVFQGGMPKYKETFSAWPPAKVIVLSP